MFTGLIEGTGIIKALRRDGGDMHLTVKPRFNAGEVVVGESVAVDGVCLTITAAAPGSFDVYVSAETLSRSTLGFLRSGDEVNLERALKLSDRLGGHLVQGHVDGIGIVAGRFPRHKSWNIRLEIPGNLFRYVIEKGSIAVDGVSLTVNRCGPKFIEVNVIPQTGSGTTLLSKRTGSRVNIETDLVGKYVEKFVSLSNSANGDGPDGDRLETLLKS
ncbi:MAG TPA: riboflavin synthase [Desulfobacteraceae bacterium]|nr:riboflavin synthase [Desulfobacteraceae bacterium]